MSVQRFHFAKRPVCLEQKQYVQEEYDHFKPNGFWYSAGDEWQEWCKSEMPHWVSKFCYLVELGDSNILQLDTKKKIFKFHEEFARPLWQGGDAIQVNWTKVAQRWDGLEIIPYHYDLRFERGLLWYYGWDVPSGCVWNLAKVSIKLHP